MIRFAVEHGKPNGNIDYKWFQSIITDGLSSALEYDFPYSAGPAIVNYHLGKGSPDYKKGDTPDAWLSYEKKNKLPHPHTYEAMNVMNVDVISSSYVKNIMLFAKSKKRKTHLILQRLEKTVTPCKTSSISWVQLQIRQNTTTCSVLFVENLRKTC